MTSPVGGFFAHTRQGAGVEHWHTLERHLKDTGARASAFSAHFGDSALAYCAGLWHDMGKYAPDWQAFLREAGENAQNLGEDTPEERRPARRRGPDHSTAGAIHALEVVSNKFVARALSLVIASHHGGLPNLGDIERRLADTEKRRRYATALSEAPSEIRITPPPSLPSFIATGGSIDDQKRRYELFVRMLFSALVDADFLDTEEFLDEGQRVANRRGWTPIADYLEPLRSHLVALAQSSTASGAVREARTSVLRWCQEAARRPPGAFSLTVPTGGGKTLSSLWFALEHARIHGLRRVIIALPFLSILDQTAAVLRQIFEPALGESVLVEHHSSITPEKDTLRNRLAAENWDAPLVVTTQVQLFDSLFARRTSACRKLHNLAESVVLLDEVQTLPVGLLNPILDVLQQLIANYHTTLLLTTATQPALHARTLGPLQFVGLDPAPMEIVPPNDLPRLVDSLRRVEIRWPDSPAATTWDSLGAEIANERQVLAIVHRRADARELWRQVGARVSGAVHLSALMCPAHRRIVLREIKEALAAEAPCRVISTQLVEAGVDVDFPVVYRAMAGFESLAQSAGRCNREGRIDRGSFRVFRAPTEPVGSLRHHLQIGEAMLAAHPELDLLSPATFRSYFDRLYSEKDRDAHGIQPMRQALRYEDVASAFRMIDEATTTIIVPFDKQAEWEINALRYGGPSRSRFRALQSYAVSVYANAKASLESHGAIELLHDSIWVLVSMAHYDDDLGLIVDHEASDRFVV